jgi:hypothetical protein
MDNCSPAAVPGESNGKTHLYLDLIHILDFDEMMRFLTLNRCCNGMDLGGTLGSWLNVFYLERYELLWARG